MAQQLSDIGLQARNKIEKHDHLTREAATRIALQLTHADHVQLAGETDGEAFRQYLAVCKLRLAEAEIEQLRKIVPTPAAIEPVASTEPPATIETLSAEEIESAPATTVPVSETIPPTSETPPPAIETLDRVIETNPPSDETTPPVIETPPAVVDPLV